MVTVTFRLHCFLKVTAVIDNLAPNKVKLHLSVLFLHTGPNICGLSVIYALNAEALMINLEGLLCRAFYKPKDVYDLCC